MLNANMDAFLQLADTDGLVDLDTDSALGDVPDDTGLTVVEFVGHTFLDCTITLDVYNLANFVDLEDLGVRHGTMLSETSGEEVSGAGSVTE